jgi:hypothetical protein
VRATAQGTPEDSAARSASSGPPADLVKVRHQVGEHLWIFEDAVGQTYLAVKQPGFQPGLHSVYSGDESTYEQENRFVRRLA